MKKIKIIVPLLFLTILIFSFYSCSKTELIELEAPSSFYLEGRILHWDKVEFSSGYAVFMNDQEYNTQDNYISLMSIRDPGTYEINVLSVGDKVNYTDSEWSSFSYQCEEIVISGYDEENYAYTLLEDESGYELDCGNSTKWCTDEALILPSYYKGLPVKRLGQCAFTPKGSQNHPNPFTLAYCNTVVKSIVLPTKLEYIGSGAFAGYMKLNEVTLPDFVTEISGLAFYGCRNLKTINLSKELKIIGDSAFSLCPLTSLVLPDKLETISDHAFENNITVEVKPNVFVTINNQNFTDLIIPASVKYIGVHAFSGCQKIEKLTLENQDFSNAFFGGGAFYDTAYINNQSEYIYLDNTKTILYKYNGTTEENLVLPDSIKYICEGAFSNNKSIKKISFNTDVFFCGGANFAGCTYLSEVNLPSKLTSIPEKMFNNCSSLTNIVIPNTVTYIGNLAFSLSAIENIILPDSVITTDSYAFQQCLELKSITLSSNLIEIGIGLFKGCTSLVEINNTSSITTISTKAFEDCNSLKNIYFPNVTDIRSYAFKNCTSLKKINLSEKVTYIGLDVFAGCTSLEEIVLPNITSMSTSIFNKCTSLNKLYFLGSDENWNVISDIIYFNTNSYTKDVEVYIYSENKPTNDGNYWHYVDNIATIW